MIDLAEELDSIRGVFSEHRIEFALCGGMVMAIHGFIRATVDLDLLVKAEDIDEIQSTVGSLGYITIGNRTSRIDAASGDTLILDLSVVTGETRDVWNDRRRILWRDKPLSVVSREGLIKLKQLRGSLQDLADVARLPDRDVVQRDRIANETPNSGSQPLSVARESGSRSPAERPVGAPYTVHRQGLRGSLTGRNASGKCVTMKRQPVQKSETMSWRTSPECGWRVRY